MSADRAPMSNPRPVGAAAWTAGADPTPLPKSAAISATGRTRRQRDALAPDRTASPSWAFDDALLQGGVAKEPSANETEITANTANCATICRRGETQ